MPFEFKKPIFAGQSAQVTCLVSEGDTPMEITWSFESLRPFDEYGITTHKFGHQGNVLLIAETSAHHQGVYTCSATNSAGRANYSSLLEIHGNVRVPTTRLRRRDRFRSYTLFLHAAVAAFFFLFFIPIIF